MDRARTMLSSLFQPSSSSSSSGEPSRRRSRRIDNNERDNQQPYNVNTFFESIFTDPLSAMFGVDTNQYHQQQHHQNPPGWQQFQQQNHQHPGHPKRVPPVSNTVLRNLPVLTITKDDLIDPTNRQCAICMEDIQIQQRVIRLIPYCGHTFCSWDCIRPWLLKQATCPICRYELPTDAGPQYEMARQTRMSYRKPRLSKYDLRHRLSVSQLKQLLSLHQLRNQQQQSQSSRHYYTVNTSKQQQQKSNTTNTSFHFTEKQEIIDHILQADDEYIDWIAMPEPVKYTVADLQKMSISQLKHVMNHEAGVYFENQKDIVEKSDMLQYFIMSGRLQIIQDDSIENYDVDNVYDDDDNYDDVGNKENGMDPLIENFNFGSLSQTKSLRKDGTMLVETVDEYDDGDNNVSNCQGGGEATRAGVPSLDSREDPTLLMEENLDYGTVSKSDPISNDSIFGSNTPATDVAESEQNTVNKAAYQEIYKLNYDTREISEYISDSDGIRISEDIELDIASAIDNNKRSHAANELAGLDAMTNHIIDDSAINYDLPKENTISTMDGVNNLLVEGAGAENYYSIANNTQDPILRTESNAHAALVATSAINMDDNYNPQMRQATDSTRKSMEPFQDRSITELKALAQALHVDISGCLERREIVQCLVKAISNRKINSHDQGCHSDASNTECVDLSILESEMFDIHETRLLTMLLGIDVAHCYNCKVSMVVAIYEAVKDRRHQIRFLQSLEPIARARSIADLHKIARQWKVNIDQCIEKREIVQRLIISKY